WIPIRPNTDAALVLALLHVLFAEGLADEEFLSRFTAGWERLRDHVLGREDGVVRDPGWAASITGVEAGRIVDLWRATWHRTGRW
ncbi:MAG: molybdopterin-dependent oxidoreductase, partial [Gemmatimonadetes bacterium]|nr:molybdopterin-dependent oxidoreductase [Actinomycetota bacterium]NIR79059.1 molybdopterin-dependent oxidoreductase [Gemmatimonadota bacterium]NIT87717.1 molybdopterin-dependent oxidoreductase [Gemmatimonadota bacterium]NIU31577.1 molybdopterin-dependent oxidoreductase [Gemmatimonadota bacterium]NIV61925.1 molybdopterin-dependent oxidoreductase [Gemmatimonadota bacterium]